MWIRRTLLGAFIILTLVLSGCGTPTAEPTPTATRTPVPVATETPLPTATTTPTPTPEPIVAAEATPFPPDVNPLTGLRVDDPELLEHAPIAIKISNSTEARPQSGMSMADLVYEHFAEGGVTRLTAIFHGTYPEYAGSVRSGRLIDLEIPAMYGGIFAFSGMSGGVKERVRASDLFPARVPSPDFGQGQPYFYRIPQEGKAFEHTLFANLEALQSFAATHEVDGRPEYPVNMVFNETLPGGPTVQELDRFEIVYLPNAFTAGWAYDPESGRWTRTMGGAPHRDALTGEQITAANVVMVFAHHIETGIWEQMIGDQSSWILSVEIQIWGSGPALIFRDGRMVQGYWRREARDHMLTFWDDAGNPVPLKPGNSWFQMVPLETPAEELDSGTLRFTPSRNFKP